MDEVNPQHTALCRFDGFELVKIITPKTIASIKPRNVRQTIAFDMLLNPEIVLNILVGKAGGGKTLCALAAAVEQVFNDSMYEKIMLIKPVAFVGDSLGYLPGDYMQKLMPLMGNFQDALIQLFPSYKDKEAGELISYLISTGKLQMEVPAYLRGRSLNHCLIILDEAQGLSRHEMKTIATRLGEGSKLICLGDPQQIDSEKNDSVNNGLIYLADAFKDQICSSHITFTKGERSEFSELAADLL